MTSVKIFDESITYGLAISPGGDFLAAACSDGVVRIVNLASDSSEVVEIDDVHFGAVRAVDFHPDRYAELATAGVDGRVCLVPVGSSSDYREVCRHSEWPFAIAFREGES